MMLWLAWRQQRFETTIGLGVFGVVCAWLLLTGLNMASTYAHLGVGACLTSSTLACAQIRDAFTVQFSQIEQMANWLNFIPLILGIALAAPFVLELETGTYRLAWTQSVTRDRWLAVRVGCIVAASAGVSLVFMAMMIWWRGPLDHLQSSFDVQAFDFEGPVVVGYTLFAAALVVAIGALLRRVVPAVALGLGLFLAGRLGVEDGLRAHYMSPITRSPAPHVWERTVGWVLDSGFRSHSGSAVDIRTVLNECASVVGIDKRQAFSCLSHHGLVDYITYQPADRFWAFQGIETALFGGVAAVLLAAAALWIRYRVT